MWLRNELLIRHNAGFQSVETKQGRALVPALSSVNQVIAGDQGFAGSDGAGGPLFPIGRTAGAGVMTGGKAPGAPPGPEGTAGAAGSNRGTGGGGNAGPPAPGTAGKAGQGMVRLAAAGGEEGTGGRNGIGRKRITVVYLVNLHRRGYD